MLLSLVTWWMLLYIFSNNAATVSLGENFDANIYKSIFHKCCDITTLVLYNIIKHNVDGVTYSVWQLLHICSVHTSPLVSRKSFTPQL